MSPGNLRLDRPCQIRSVSLHLNDRIIDHPISMIRDTYQVYASTRKQILRSAPPATATSWEECIERFPQTLPVAMSTRCGNREHAVIDPVGLIPIFRTGSLRFFLQRPLTLQLMSGGAGFCVSTVSIVCSRAPGSMAVANVNPGDK